MGKRQPARRAAGRTVVASRPRRATSPTTDADATSSRTGSAAVARRRADHPFASDEGRNWFSTGLTAAAIGALGLVLAGSLAIAGPEASANDRPDTSRAEPAGFSPNDDDSQGHTEQRQGQDDPGTLDEFDRRRQSSGRDAVREQLDQARTNKRSQQRGTDLEEQRRKAAERQQDEASKDRDGDLDRARREAKDEAERKRIEEERRLEEARRAAEEERLRRERELAGNGELNSPPPFDDSDLNDGAVTTPLRPGSYVLGASFGQYGVWARYHTGQDFPAPIGTPILAVKDGVVVSSPGGWAGISVGLQHAGGDGTLYAHMSRRVVNVGQTVRAGQVIGYVGVTGNTSGPHLHFEYYPPGTKIGDVYRAQNPLAWLRAHGVRV